MTNFLLAFLSPVLGRPIAEEEGMTASVAGPPVAIVQTVHVVLAILVVFWVAAVAPLVVS